MRWLEWEPPAGFSLSLGAWILESCCLLALECPDVGIDYPSAVVVGEEGTAVDLMIAVEVEEVEAAALKSHQEGVHFSSDLTLCGNAEFHDGDLAGQKKDHHQSRRVYRKHHEERSLCIRHHLNRDQRFDIHLRWLG